jgi:hypothetical protein
MAEIALMYPGADNPVALWKRGLRQVSQADRDECVALAGPGALPDIGALGADAAAADDDSDADVDVGSDPAEANALDQALESSADDMGGAAAGAAVAVIGAGVEVRRSRREKGAVFYHCTLCSQNVPRHQLAAHEPLCISKNPGMYKQLAAAAGFGEFTSPRSTASSSSSSSASSSAPPPAPAHDVEFDPYLPDDVPSSPFPNYRREVPRSDRQFVPARLFGRGVPRSDARSISSDSDDSSDADVAPGGSIGPNPPVDPEHEVEPNQDDHPEYAELDEHIDDALADADDDVFASIPHPAERLDIDETAQTDLLERYAEEGAMRFAVRQLQATLGGSMTLAAADENLKNIADNLKPHLDPQVAHELPDSIAACINLLKPTFGKYQRLDVCRCEQHIYGHYKGHGGQPGDTQNKHDDCPHERWTKATADRKNGRDRKPAFRDTHIFDTEATLRRWFANVNTARALRYASTQYNLLAAGEAAGKLPTGDQREIGDVYTGELWREKFFPRFGQQDVRHLAFMLSADGGQPYKKCGSNLWPITLACLNLPPHLRQMPGFMLLAGLGDFNNQNHKATMHNFSIYLKPVLQWMRKMSTTGIRVYDAIEQNHFTLKATILFTCTDYKALYKIAKTSTTGAPRACHRCDLTGHNFRTVVPGAGAANKPHTALGSANYPGAYLFLPDGHPDRYKTAGATDSPGADGACPSMMSHKWFVARAQEALAWLQVAKNKKTHKGYPGRQSGVHDLDPLHIWLNVGVVPQEGDPPCDALLYSEWWHTGRQHMYDPLHTNDINAAGALLSLLWPGVGKKSKTKGPFKLARRKFEKFQRRRPSAFTRPFMQPANFRAIALRKVVNRNRRRDGQEEYLPVQPQKKMADPGWELSGKSKDKNKPADIAVAVRRLTHHVQLGRMHGGSFCNAFQNKSHLYARDRRMIMGPVLAYVLNGLPSLSAAASKAIVELSWHVRTSSHPRFTVAELERLRKSAILTVSHAEAQLPTSFASISTHQLLHLPEEIFQAGTCVYWWLYGAERYIHTYSTHRQHAQTARRDSTHRLSVCLSVWYIWLSGCLYVCLSVCLSG